MKKILIIVLTISLVFLIYILNYDKKTYYVALGDAYALGINNYGEEGYGYSYYVKEYLDNNDSLEYFSNDFAYKDYRTTDLIRDIVNNKSINEKGQKKYIQNLLIKADILTLSIGMNDLIYSFTANLDPYKSITSTLNDLDELYSLILKYCKEKVYIVGIYNPYYSNHEDILIYYNNKLKELANKYKFTYIDIYDKFKNNDDLHTYNSLYPTNLGYKKISEEIIKDMWYNHIRRW